MKQKIQEWFPDAWNQLNLFYARRAGVTVDTWKRAMEVIISDNLFGLGDNVVDPDEAKDIVRKVINILPPMRTSGWTDENGVEFIEFEVTPTQLNQAYFEEVRRILNVMFVPDQ